MRKREINMENGLDIEKQSIERNVKVVHCRVYRNTSLVCPEAYRLSN